MEKEINGGLSKSEVFTKPAPHSETHVMGHAVMRAKMQVASVTKFESGPESLRFTAVCKSDGYPADGVDEDNSFARWTPTAELHMQVMNPALWGQFKDGDKFYVDFTPAK